jgi:hypothetical protein
MIQPKETKEADGEEHYWVKITDRFAALENSNDVVDINRAWEDIRENIKIFSEKGLVC